MQAAKSSPSAARPDPWPYRRLQPSPLLRLLMLVLAAGPGVAQESFVSSVPRDGGTLEIHSHTSAIFGDNDWGDANRIAVWLPTGYDASDQRYRVVYLLHGLGGTFGHFLSAPREVQLMVEEGRIQAPILVMPNRPGMGRMIQYSDYMVEELIPLIDATFRTLPDRTARAVGGWSHGGINALIAAVAHPEAFAAAASMATGNVERDVFSKLVVGHKQYRFPLAFWLQWGTADAVVRSPLPFVELLERLHFVPHTYLETGDGHDSSISRNTDEALAFLVDHMGPAAYAPPLIFALTEQLILNADRSAHDLELHLRLRRPLPPGEALLVDASRVGITDAARFLPEDGDLYTTDLQITRPLANGIHGLPVLHADATGSLRYLTAVLLKVLPGSDLSLFATDVGPAWTLDVNRRVVPTPTAFADRPALALEGSGSWRATFEAAAPLDLLGYEALHFAFHPADHTLREGREARLQLGTVDLLARVDLDLQQWQTVVLDIADLGLPEGALLLDVRFSGNLEGTFYLADIRLVAEELPADLDPRITAVTEPLRNNSPDDVSLDQNDPNPFNSGTVIRFTLERGQDVELAVYNLSGQKVAQLVDGKRGPGQHSVHWDGRDITDRLLASGLYLYRLRAGRRSETRKLLLVR